MHGNVKSAVTIYQFFMGFSVEIKMVLLGGKIEKVDSFIFIDKNNLETDTSTNLVELKLL